MSKLRPKQHKQTTVTSYYVSAVPVFAVTSSWSLVNTTGAVVKGGYGHSSIYDELTGVILVHGGYHSMSAATYLLTDALYEFNPNTSAWYVYSCYSFACQEKGFASVA